MELRYIAYRTRNMAKFGEGSAGMDRDQRLIEFCQEAIRIPSPSGQEQGVAQLMKRKMEE